LFNLFLHEIPLKMAYPLKIAIIADPYLPVPPTHYGGIERIIAFLVEGLIKRGHHVTLWAHPKSTVPCELVPYGSPPHMRTNDRLRELLQVSSPLFQHRTTFDLVHSFGRLAALLPLFPLPIPKIQSYQRPIALRSIKWASKLAGNSIFFTACSTNCRQPVSHLGRWATIHNGVRLADYTFQAEVSPDAPLVFLGRLERIKGAHTAIAIAKATGRKLIIAGNVVAEEEHQCYFNREIASKIDNEQIKYAGPVNDVQKNELLGNAAALLMPIEWEEPFGIVMVEALACGTPVIGFERGAVPEVIENNISGYVCKSFDDMLQKVQSISQLDRRAVRIRAETHFSDQVIVDAYECLYHYIVTQVNR